MAEDSLYVMHMNVKPGGKQRVMRDGWWGGKPQIMNFANRYLRERSLCWRREVWTLGTCDMRGTRKSS